MEGDSLATADNHSAVSDMPGRKYIRHRRSASPDSGISPEAIPEPGSETSSCLVDTPFPYEKINEDTPETAYRRIIDQVGCSFARDSYDTEVIAQMVAGRGDYGTDGIINSPSDVGGWPSLRSGTPQADTDGDGIPDAWEQAHGLNPADPTDALNIAPDSSGYTNLELYLNSLIKYYRHIPPPSTVMWFRHR